MKKSIHLLWLVLPIACSSPAPPGTTDGFTPPGISIRPRAPRHIIVGGVQQLAADTPGGGQVTWQSSDPDVAAVSTTGLVRGVRVGRALVTATVTYANGDEGTAATSIAVRPSPQIEPIASRRHRRR